MSRLDDVQARVDDTASGPWTVIPDGNLALYKVASTSGLIGDGTFLREDAVFIAHAREDIPALLAVAEAARRFHDTYSGTPMTVEEAAADAAEDLVRAIALLLAEEDPA